MIQPNIVQHQTDKESQALEALMHIDMERELEQDSRNDINIKKYENQDCTPSSQYLQKQKIQLKLNQNYKNISSKYLLPKNYNLKPMYSKSHQTNISINENNYLIDFNNINIEKRSNNINQNIRLEFEKFQKNLNQSSTIIKVQQKTPVINQFNLLYNHMSFKKRLNYYKQQYDSYQYNKKKNFEIPKTTLNNTNKSIIIENDLNVTESSIKSINPPKNQKNQPSSSIKEAIKVSQCQVILREDMIFKKKKYQKKPMQKSLSLINLLKSKKKNSSDVNEPHPLIFKNNINQINDFSLRLHLNKFNNNQEVQDSFTLAKKIHQNTKHISNQIDDENTKKIKLLRRNIFILDVKSQNNFF